MNLSFAGCGFLGIYHVGVAVCFRKYAPHLLLEKISGASFGAISACCLLCDLPLGEITNDVLRAVGEVRSGSLGPFSPSFNVQSILLEGLVKFLPDDCHLRVSGKLHISLTRVYDGKNVIASQFNSKEDLLQALMASCFIPVFSGFLPPRFHGIRYMDGGFSDNLPILDENTITVSPFCGESDICPRDLSSQLFHVNFANTSIELSKQNINRFVRILFPPKPEVLSNMCKQGFDDALRFLHRNNLISCTRCLAVQSTFQIQETLDDTLDYDPECLECKSHRQEALVANLPDTVMTVFQNAIDSANKGLINWMMRHKSLKLLSLMTIPYRLPVDIMYATITKIIRSTPYMSTTLRSLGETALSQLCHLLYNSQHQHPQHRPQMSALTALSAPCYRELDAEASPLKALQKASIMSMGAENSFVPFTGSEDDTFEQILKVTAQQEALMAYYYMDENNKMKVTEIFDVTDAEGDGVQSPTEKDANVRLEFDEDWGGDICDDYEFEGESDISIEDSTIDKNIFSDPESEWGRGHSPSTIQEIEEDLSRPESDQPHRKYTPKADDYTFTVNDP